MSIQKVCNNQVTLMFWQFHFSASVCITSLFSAWQAFPSLIHCYSPSFSHGKNEVDLVVNKILLRCFFLLVECSTKRQTGLTPSSSFSIFSLFVSSSRASSHLVHNRHHREEHHKCVKKRMHTDCCQLLFDLWQQRRRILKVQQRWEICTTSMLAPFLRLAYWKKKAEKCWWLFYESPFSELIYPDLIYLKGEPPGSRMSGYEKLLWWQFQSLWLFAVLDSII